MFNDDYSDMLSAFAEEGVEYMVVGAFAVAAHGLPRATGDMDLWVRPTPENAARLQQALASFGVARDALAGSVLVSPDTVVQIGDAPSCVHLRTSVSGVEFADAWGERMTVHIERLDVSVIGRRHLLANKLALGRLSALADADAIRRAEAYGHG